MPKRPERDGKAGPVAIFTEGNAPDDPPVVHYHFPVEIEVRGHTGAAAVDVEAISRDVAERLARAIRARR